MSSLHLSTTATTPFSLLKSNPPKRPPHSTSTHFHPSAAPLSLLRFQNLRRPSPEVAAAADVGAAVAEEELRRELMPRHVAVIMDGNVRWARQRGLPGSAGHEAGVQSLRNLVELCGKWGVQVLPVFAFSYDNWARPKVTAEVKGKSSMKAIVPLDVLSIDVEVDFLMKLFERGIQSELDIFIRLGIRISVIGDTSKLSTSLQKLISQAENDTKDNTKLQLIVAVSYSGKYDIVQACRNIAQKVKDGVVESEGH